MMSSYRNGKATRVLRATAGPSELKLLDLLSVDAALAAPVFSGGEWWGVISLFGLSDAEEWQAADMELLQGAANAVGAALAVAEKTTELALANQALTRRESYFRALLQGSSDLIAVLDEELCFTYASPAAKDLFDRTPPELLNTPFLDRLHPAEVDDVGWKLAQLTAGTPVLAFEAKTRVGGDWRRLAATVRDARGDPHVGGYVLNGPGSHRPQPTAPEAVQSGGSGSTDPRGPGPRVGLPGR
jgi:PAS domain-containing protein